MLENNQMLYMSFQCTDVYGCPKLLDMLLTTLSRIQSAGLTRNKETQRNRYPETGCNGTPSLSNMTDFDVNVTETFSDGARVRTMVIDEHHRTVPST